MSNIPPKGKYLYESPATSLNNGESIDSGWMDMQSADKYQFEGRSALPGMTMTINSSNTQGGGAVDDINSITPISDSTFHLFNVICRQRYMRFQWTNNTGSSISNCSMNIKATYGSSDKLSVFPVYTTPSKFSQAALVQSIMRGIDANGDFQQVGVNTGGALLTADFGTDVARGNISGWSVFTKFGRNPVINTGTTPEDVYNGGGTYTGFNATSNQNLRVLSSQGADTGIEVSSGTATLGSDAFNLIDSSATFISDGVAIGDCVINDTGHCHGFITSIDSETSLTVFRMTNGIVNQYQNSVGDSYRIASSTGTGCAVIRIQSILNSTFEKQPPAYVILNGANPVIYNIDAMRCSVAKAVLSGSNGKNVGEITITQETDTTNVFAVVPTTGRTTIGCTTVPKDKIYAVKRIRGSIVRANGSPGSATVIMYTREPGGSWNGDRVFELQTGASVDFKLEGAMVFVEGTDIKFTVGDVSDNGTVCEVAMETYEIDETNGF